MISSWHSRRCFGAAEGCEHDRRWRCSYSGCSCWGKLVALRVAFLHKADICKVLREYVLFLLNDVFVLGPRSHRHKRMEKGELAEIASLGLIFWHVRAHYRIHFETRLACLRTRDERPKKQAPDTHLTCCLFTQVPLPAAVAFTPISSSFCFIRLQRPRCRKVLEAYVAWFDG